MLGVQLYDLISQAGMEQQQVVAFYSFMTQLGMAAQAIDIVYQLNAPGDDRDKARLPAGRSRRWNRSPSAPNAGADVRSKGLHDDERLLAFRYHDLILLKNQSSRGIVVRGPPAAARRVLPRLFRAAHRARRAGAHLPGSRLLLQREEKRLAHADLPHHRQRTTRCSSKRCARGKRAGGELRAEGAGARAEERGRAAQWRRSLRDGARLEATLDDKIIFHNDSELPLSDLRRRARALGGRFQLKAYKTGYLVSNNPVAARRGRHPAFARHRRRSAAEDPLRLRKQGRQAGGAAGRPPDPRRRSCRCETATPS